MNSENMLKNMGKNREAPDYILLICTGLIILLGFAIFTSVSMAKIAATEEALSRSDLFLFIIRQFVSGLFPGLLLALFLYKIPLEKIKKIAPFLLLLNIILVGLVFVPGMGVTIRGARRWLQIGPISFQPSEFLKLTFVLYLASWLSSRDKLEKENIFSETFIAFGAVCGLISGFIISQPDFSTLAVIILTGFVMYSSYKAPIKQIITIAAAGLFSVFGFIVLSPYRLKRVVDLLISGSDSQGLSYQAHQALISIGSGGLFGLGFGMSNQKYGFIPFSMSDSIFAIYAEEAGFIGSLLLVSLFLVFFWRGIKLAKENKDSFFSLVATGISFWIFFQAFVHIGSMAGILPITGIPLPFISYGRAHLVTELSAFGILMNISKS